MCVVRRSGRWHLKDVFGVEVGVVGTLFLRHGIS